MALICVESLKKKAPPDGLLSGGTVKEGLQM